MPDKFLAAVSPVYGAVTGEGMFGDLLGKKSEIAAEEAKAAAAKAQAEEDKARAEREAQAQADNAAWAKGMKRGGKVKSSAKSSPAVVAKGWGKARGARAAKIY
jgi:hypothetical protein